eukprot:COSAG04_NODE_5431_length_1622_cov_0.858831_1_plen_443_part_10
MLYTSGKTDPLARIELATRQVGNVLRSYGLKAEDAKRTAGDGYTEYAWDPPEQSKAFTYFQHGYNITSPLDGQLGLAGHCFPTLPLDGCDVSFRCCGAFDWTEKVLSFFKQHPCHQHTPHKSDDQFPESLRKVSVTHEWGVNVWAPPQHVAQLSTQLTTLSSAFKLARIDATWAEVEAVKGSYNWTRLDVLIGALSKHAVQAYVILDYGNTLYEGASDATRPGMRIRTPEGRAAFARFAVAMMQRFRSEVAYWEVWNEPNSRTNKGGFWEAAPNCTAEWDPCNAADYVALVESVARAKSTDALLRQETIVGPAADGGWVGLMDDGKWLQQVFALGLLKSIDAVSVHPYRHTAPETVLEDYAKLQVLIKRYNGGEAVRLISSEWGYVGGQGALDDLQAKYLPRQWLANWVGGASTSIWFKWFSGQQPPFYGVMQETPGDGAVLK